MRTRRTGAGTLLLLFLSIGLALCTAPISDRTDAVEPYRERAGPQTTAIDPSKATGANPGSTTRTPADPAEPASRIRGLLMDAAGTPIAGARVWREEVDLSEPVRNTDAFRQGMLERSAVTHANGFFDLPAGAGRHDVWIEAAGYPRVVLESLTAAPRANAVDVTLLAPPAARVIAHRAGAAAAPENTVAAIEKAVLMGADVLEVDVRLTVDGVPIVIHDAELDRTTDGSGPVSAATWEDVRTLEAGAWFHPSFAGERVPSLAQALEAIRDTSVTLRLDLKTDGNAPGAVERAAWQAVEEAQMASRVELSGFGHATGPYCRAMTASRCLMITQDAAIADAWTTAPVVGSMVYGGVVIPSYLATPGRVAAAHAAGLEVHVWGPWTPAAIADAVERDIDGISADDPSLVHRAFTGLFVRVEGSGRSAG